jgi:hypothetical protein
VVVAGASEPESPGIETFGGEQPARPSIAVAALEAAITLRKLRRLILAFSSIISSLAVPTISSDQFIVGSWLIKVETK